MRQDDSDGDSSADHDGRNQGEARCFRCGRMQPRATLRALEEDVPAAFRGKPLCIVCLEAARGKKGGGWWAQAG